jgi:hypothetical protein
MTTNRRDSLKMKLMEILNRFEQLQDPRGASLMINFLESFDTINIPSPLAEIEDNVNDSSERSKLNIVSDKPSQKREVIDLYAKMARVDINNIKITSKNSKSEIRQTSENQGRPKEKVQFFLQAIEKSLKDVTRRKKSGLKSDKNSVEPNKKWFGGIKK